MKSSAWHKFRQTIIRMITSEWEKKLAAVILAGLLWFYVNSLSYVEKTVSLPIQFRNLPENLMIVETYDSAASLVVKGKTEQVKTVNLAKAIKPVVSLEQAVPGTSSYPIEIILNTPQQDLIINLTKDKARLKIDEIATNHLPIEPQILGVPKSGYILDDIILDRKTVMVRGPLEFLTSSNSIATKPVSISGATNDIRITVGLNPPKNVTVIGADHIYIIARIIKKDDRFITNSIDAFSSEIPR